MAVARYKEDFLVLWPASKYPRYFPLSSTCVGRYRVNLRVVAFTYIKYMPMKPVCVPFAVECLTAKDF